MPKRNRPPDKKQPAPPATHAQSRGKGTLTMQQAMQQAAAAYSHRDWVEAEQLCRRVLNAKPGHFDALTLLGIIAAQTGHATEAAALFSHARDANPNEPAAHNNLGNVLKELKRFDEALACYGQAIKLAPGYAEAYFNRGIALKELRRWDEALNSYDRAIMLKPGYADAYTNRGLVLKELKRWDEALDSYDQAIKLNPGLAEAHSNRGIALKNLKRLDQALDSFGRAMQLKPDLEFLYGDWLHTKMTLCDWGGIEYPFAECVKRIERGEKAIAPFPLLALTGSLQLQRRAAEIWVNGQQPASPALPAIAKSTRRGKIRIGYYSADYHNHATTYLMAGLFERHDRNRFDLVAFSYGPDQNDDMRKRVSAAFDQFVDVRTKSDQEVALLSRNMGIDIAVDLKGFTQDQRVGIFSYRAAPIQVNYLGYPGTMGAEYIDYLIADRTLIPGASQQHYSEKIVYLPNSYQVNDRKRQIADKRFSREELGLPQAGFVFCCFNNSYKITPGTFDGWMRILKQVDGSVLWLLEDHPAAAGNLRKEAEARGVSADRLIFARRMPLSEHLARQRAADLFIDTLPCNAHTTASDALWAGLPVLTCAGEAFASRVAASLLHAIHLPELITSTQEEYEQLAIALATDPGRLAGIGQKLEANRLTTPLFDTDLFAKHIEAAYTQMYERYQADLPPEHVHVAT